MTFVSNHGETDDVRFQFQAQRIAQVSVTLALPLGSIGEERQCGRAQ
jgi:hypothetical protein